MKPKEAIAHMKSAYAYAELSHCKRRQVGCVIVKDHTPIAIGYNGTPEGWDNCCEGSDGLTLPHVIHAEANAVGKLAANVGGGRGASVFVTIVPCLSCAIQLASAKIKELYYAEEYRNLTEGVEHLRKNGITVIKLDMPPTDKNN